MSSDLCESVSVYCGCVCVWVAWVGPVGIVRRDTIEAVG